MPPSETLPALSKMAQLRHTSGTQVPLLYLTRRSLQVPRILCGDPDITNNNSAVKDTRVPLSLRTFWVTWGDCTSKVSSEEAGRIYAFLILPRRKATTQVTEELAEQTSLTCLSHDPRRSPASHTQFLIYNQEVT